MNESTDAWSKYEYCSTTNGRMGALVYDRMKVSVYEVWENEISVYDRMVVLVE